MSDGAVAGRERRDVVERHAAEPRRRHRQLRRSPACGRAVACAARAGAPRTARRLRCRSSPDRRRPAAAAPRPHREICTPRSAAFGRSSCTDSSGLPTFSEVSTSTTPGSFLAASTTAAANVSSFFRSGPLIMNWISAFWLPPPPIVATGRTPVRRLADRERRQDRRCGPRSSPRTDRARARRSASAGRRPTPRFCVCAGSSADRHQRVTRPRAAAGSASAIRLAMTSVASRLVPSGARRLTSNSDWSSCGSEVLVRRS